MEKKNDSWQLKDSIVNHTNGAGVDEARLQKIENCDFKITTNSEPNSAENSYLLNGRVYMDKRNYGSVEGPSPGGGLSKREWEEEDISHIYKDEI